MKIDVRQKSDNTETDTVLSDKLNKRREQLRYETYEHLNLLLVSLLVHTKNINEI